MSVKTECHGDVVFKKGDRTIIDCGQCGYMHVSPMYNQKELEQFYKDIYSESTPSYLMHEKVYNIKKWKEKGLVLDIGCWEGDQLEYFIREGWKCTGIELNKRVASIAASKGITVHNVSIQEFFEQFINMQWDVINVAYILEHIPYPADFLTNIKKNLKKDGIIIVEVPNEFNSAQLAYIKEKNIRPYWFALPDHVNYFTRDGIENILERTGWKVSHAEASFPMEMFLLMGDDYLADNSIGKKSFKKVVEMERILRAYDPGLVSRIYSALYRCNIGRSVILYAQSL